MATGIQVVFDCADPDRLARFWATALHYRVQDPPDGFTSWEAWLADAGVPEDEWNSASAIVDPDGAGRVSTSSGCRRARSPRIGSTST